MVKQQQGFNATKVSIYSYNYINNSAMESQAELCFLNQENLEEVVALTIATKTKSPFVVYKIVTLQGIAEETRHELIDYIQIQEKYNKLLGISAQSAPALRLNGKIVGMIMRMDAAEYYKMANQSLTAAASPFYQLNRMFANLPADDMKPGMASFFTRLAVLPSLQRKGIASRLTYQFYKLEALNGCQYAYCFTLLEYNLRFQQKFGGKVIMEEDYINPNFTFKVSLIKIDVQKAIQIYESSTLQAKP